MKDVLALERWQTRFRDAATEAQYLRWAIVASIPFNRIGCWLALANWSVVVPQLVFIGAKRSGSFGVVMGTVVIPVIVLSLVMTYRTSLQRFMQPTTALANMLAGLVSVIYINWLIDHDPVHASSEAAMAGFVILNFYGFVVLRTTTLQAVLAVGPYMLLENVLLVLRARSVQIAGLDTTIMVIAFATGLFINVVFDITSRRAFRQELIIEGQKQTIAEERAKSEALLKQELSHQVAERSRELGELLAQGDAPFEPSDVSIGARFDGRYRITRELGEGGMGRVFEVARVTDGEVLALKVVTGPVSRANAVRFAREAEIGARLRHDNLVSIVDVGISAGAPFLVMELVRGETLESERARFGDAPWALAILRQVAAGLAALHKAGVVHRDLKPGNVLLCESRAKISDFGISRFGIDDAELDVQGATLVATPKRRDLTGTGALLGTPLYMPPEAARGGRALLAASDIFSFGIVAYEALCGRAPFEIPPVLLALAGQPIPKPAPLSGDVDATVCAMLEACLSSDAGARPSAARVYERLSPGSVA
jgi:hypothetical protein